ncbi:hypothetical protein ONZ45_g8743 [Pleurotus djamor]|nr:hypothetical protein ONZ45_g8743 [Pleurotus djamor]
MDGFTTPPGRASPGNGERWAVPSSLDDYYDEEPTRSASSQPVHPACDSLLPSPDEPIGTEVQQQVQRRVREILHRPEDNMSYCMVTNFREDMMVLHYVQVISSEIEHPVQDKLGWSWSLRHGELDLNTPQNLMILETSVRTLYRRPSNWFWLPQDTQIIETLHDRYVTAGKNQRYSPSQAYTSLGSSSFTAKLILSAGLQKSIAFAQYIGPYPEDEDEDFTPDVSYLQFDYPPVREIHIPPHYLIFDVGKKLSARYPYASNWDEIRANVPNDYLQTTTEDERLLKLCFEIYIAWMDSEPTEDWLADPVSQERGS